MGHLVQPRHAGERVGDLELVEAQQREAAVARLGVALQVAV
jgi:hypothetical protein